MFLKKNLRLILTILVVLIGGYCIQQYSAKSTLSSMADGAHADEPHYGEAAYASTGGK